MPEPIIKRNPEGTSELPVWFERAIAQDIRVY